MDLFTCTAVEDGLYEVCNGAEMCWRVKQDGGYWTVTEDGTDREVGTFQQAGDAVAEAARQAFYSVEDVS